MNVFLLDRGFAIEKPGEESGPKWNQLFPANVTKYRKDFPGGKIEFTDEVLGTFARNYAAMGKPRLALNYFHRGMSVPGDTTPIDAKVAAGWIVDVEHRPGKGLWALMDFTKRAREYVNADEITQLSPEFALNYVNTDTGKSQGPTLLGAALLNDPFLKELPRVAASDNPNAAYAAGAPTMKKLANALGLADDATEDQMLAALAEFMKKKDAPDPEKEKAFADLQSQVTSLSDLHKGTAEKLAESQKELEAMKQAAKDAEVKSLCDKLVAEGKVLPAQTDTLKTFILSAGAEKVEAFYAEMKPVVEMGEQGVESGPGPKTKDAAAAQKRLDDRIAEMRKADASLTFTDAHRLALSEMPEVGETLFGNA